MTDAYTNLADVLLESGDLVEAEKYYRLKLETLPTCSKSLFGLGSLFFKRNQKKEAVDWLERALVETSDDDESKRFIKIAIKSLAENRPSKEQLLSKTTIFPSEPFAFFTNREVEPGLILAVLATQKKTLNETSTADSRYGPGDCSIGFDFFESNDPYIKRAALDLTVIMEQFCASEVAVSDSFFNIFRAGCGSKRHSHLSKLDRHFDLALRKYSLVYYLDVGDQACEEPGLLELHNPNFRFLPANGSIVILDGSRPHSSKYSGNKDRLMIGVNFYVTGSASFER